MSISGSLEVGIFDGSVSFSSNKVTVKYPKWDNLKLTKSSLFHFFGTFKPNQELLAGRIQDSEKAKARWFHRAFMIWIYSSMPDLSLEIFRL